MKPEVVVIGDVDTDVFVKVPHIPTWDEGVLAEAVYERPGGKGANTAAALSRLGTPAGMMAFAGDDRYGEIAREGLQKSNVDLSHLHIVKGEKTYHCIMMLDPSGEKALIVFSAPTIYPDPRYIREHKDYLLSVRHVHAIGLAPEKVLAGLEIAHDAGLTTSVDLDSARSGIEGCTPVIQKSTIVFVNAQGASVLFPGLDELTAARRLSQLGPQVVVITRGRRGPLAFDGVNMIEVASFEVEVVDTTGAGDCFSAAFIHGFLKHWDLKTCLQFASAAAALSTREIGGQAALPTEDEVRLFLETQTSNRR